MLATLFEPASGQTLSGIFDPWMVAQSVVVAIFTATLALQMVELAARGDTWLRVAAIGTGSIALGAGIWAMHFIAMLAFNLCAVTYDPLVTGLSMLPSLAASAVALTVVARPRISKRNLVAGGILVGGGIGAMHYVGMSAMRMIPVLRYDPFIFALSIVVAVVLAVLALWIRFRLRSDTVASLRRARLLGAGTVMGLAITGMHYIGMAAARFYGDPAIQTPDTQADTGPLALDVTVITVFIVLLVAGINALLRYRALVSELQASESRIRAIMATAVDGIISVRSDGTVRHINRAAERIFGWSAAELAGRNVSVLMASPQRDEHDSHMRRYLDTQLPHIIGSAREVTGQRKDGSLVPLRLAVGHAQMPNEDVFVGFVTDITDRLLLEQDLRDAKSRAEQAAAARTNFLANMSHEIRTPMNSILGFVELLLESPLSDEQSNTLTIVRNSARSLLRLLNEILDSAKLDRGAMELVHLPFDLRILAREVVAAATGAAAAKRLGLDLIYDPALPTRFLGDEFRLRQVLGNLLGNAVKFTEQGSVSLAISADSGYVRFTVSDSGIGIAEDRLEHIFEPFTQADASLSRRYGGTGLGTTISKQLVKLMQGTIEVESELGKGTRFDVRLPLTPTKDSPLDPVEPAVESPALPALRILCVDDVPQNLELLKMMLTPMGHIVVATESGEAALSLAAQTPFDVILLDIRMPGMSGLEVAQRMRERERANATIRVPILALSASVLEEDRQQTRDAGMDGFVAKPIERADLLRAIARALGIGAARRPAPLSPQSRVIFDRAGALTRWDNDWEVLAGMLRQFFRQQRQLPTQLAEQLRRGAKRSALETAHQVKGLAGNLGLASIMTMLSAFEEAVKRDDPEIPLDAVAQALEDARQALTAELDTRTADPAMTAAPAPIDPARLRRALADIGSAIKQGALDDRALTALAEMLPDSDVEPLRAALDEFDFGQAEALVAALAARQDHPHAG